MLQLRTVNKKVQEKFGDEITLYKDDGYFYFAYDCDSFKGLIYETRSVMANSLNQLTLDQWLDEAHDLTETVRKIYNEREFVK